MRSPLATLLSMLPVPRPGPRQDAPAGEIRRNPIRVPGVVVVAVLSLVAVDPSRLSAQGPASNSGQLSKFGAIQDFGTDAIDLSSLNARLDIPVLKKPGRGLNLNSHITHDNVFSSSGASQFGWVTALENLTGQVFYTQVGHGCQGYIKWVYRDEYGTLHNFPSAISGTCVSTVSGTADDGTGLVLTPGKPWLGPSQATATVTGPDGASWKVASTASSSPSPYVPSGNVVDANGNEISISTTGVVDTLGSVGSSSTISIQNYWQPFQTTPGTTVPPETYTYTDASGAPRQITINYGLYSLDNFPPPSPCSAAFQGPGVPAYANLPQSINFPNNIGYTFSYEMISGLATGRISSVVLPTGGSISYNYLTPTGGGKNNDCIDNGAFALNRTTSNGTWTYTRTLSTYVGTVGLTTTTTATAPTGETTVYTFMYYPLSGYNNYTYLETSKAVYQGAPTGVPLLYQQTCYNGFSPPCASETHDNLPNASSGIISTTDDYVSYNGGPNARKTTTYENPLYAPIEVDEYDFGASTPTRKTFTTYLSVNGVQTNKVSSVIVKDGNDTTFSQTESGYDETAAVPTSQVPQHSAVTGNRGNLTSSSVWRLSDGIWLKTTYTNDDTGNRLTATDPCGNTTCSDVTGTNHTTTYSYTDSPSGANPAGNSNAYLTQITYPNTGVAHIENYQYSYNSGGRTQWTDQNNVITNYSFSDPLDRPTLVDNAVRALNQFGQPAERKTSFSYPSATEVDVAQDDYTTGDALLTSSTLSDGLGRLIKTVGRDGSVVETAYDAFNRVCAVSNPTFNDPGPLSCVASNNPGPINATDGITYVTYDALGRKTRQTQPDGNTLQWIPSGNVVDFYDEDGSHWQRTSDALGRLTKVLENDPAGSRALTLETDYTYDPLDNMTSVNQKGASGDTARYRTLLYDSLSRLTNACNPEAIATGSSCTSSGPWSVIYSYDANGNVSKRTDARGIVTNYSYDALNRITGKSYTNDPANTPALSYSYDTEYSWQVRQFENRPVGHLNGITATVGTTNVAAWASGDYDQRGNLTGYFTCLGSNVQTCPTASGAAADIAYDLNDSLISFWDVSGNATLSQAFGYFYTRDNAGRLYRIQTEVGPNYSSNGGYVFSSDAFSGATYYPGGAVKTANLAIDPVTQAPGISLSRTLDNRGRLTGETDINSQQQTVYNYSVNYDGNGNVTGYNDSAAGTWTVNNDAIHRLLNMSGTVGGVAYTAQETYDHFGNRNVETVTAGSDQMQPSSYLHFSAGNNRADEGIYDNAGDPFSDGANNYLYDAENRICAVQQIAAGSGGSLIGYLYAPDGTRLGKANLTSFSCDMTQNGMLTANGPVLTNLYTVGPQGEQFLETDGNFNLKHFNVFWEGKVLGSYSGTPYAQSNWHFALNDWLGTKRVVTNSDGTYANSFFSGPFGDFQTPSGTGSDPSEHHFTGKERDIESGLDYFPARYYNSYVGRFMSPDWSSDPDPVPYADFTSPQSLNLYSYAGNSPLTNSDADGHDDCQGQTTVITVSSPDNSVRGDLGTSYSAHSSPCGSSRGGGQFTGGSSSVQQATQSIQSATHQVMDYLRAPRDMTCLTNATASGAGAGAAMGAGLGLAGGPLAEITVPGVATIGFGFGAVAGWGMGMSACKTGDGGGGKTEHGQERADEAAAGDKGRQVGDPNRVIREGKKYVDSETGNTVHVSGDRVVITNAEGNEVSQFTNSRANTQQRVLEGKWIPQ